MRKLIWIGILLSIVVFNINAETNMLKTFAKSYKESDLNKCLEKGLAKMGIDISKSIPDENLSAINYILKHTYENNIHKMRGEKDNTVYINNDGREAVYDKDGNLVTNDWNKASFNFASYDQPVNKFLMDIFPWMVWGNARKDPTTFEERLYYYCLDLDRGIQSYLFLEDKTELETISFSDLGDYDRLVYHLFNYLLFNEKYEIKISEDSIPELQKNADYYWKYFYQIMDLIGFKKNF